LRRGGEGSPFYLPAKFSGIFMKKRDYNYHGMRKTTTYNVWSMMKYRCDKKDHPSYRLYGLRGIKYCERWKKFKNFLDDMGERPDGLSLDRIDNDGDYCRENCKWATGIEQINNRRNTVWLTLNGERLPRGEWCRRLGLHKGALDHRMRAGWSDKRVLETPFRKRTNRTNIKLS
jgi:hypothetical protein